MKYRLTIAYDGTDYAGWQVQPHAFSVAQIMQDTFYRVFNKEIKLVGASRTDAGVHAIEQVAVCSVDLAIDSDRIMHAWNDALPPTIVIRSVEVALDDFHPIYGVKEKTYWYHFFLERPLPFVERYGWFFQKKIDIDRLQQALNVFVGTHDFRSFCTGIDMGSNTIRTITSIALSKEAFGAWRITVKGPGFMRYMIRRIVGASLAVASKDTISAQDLKDILHEKNPRQTLMNAPAKGLCLYAIAYNKK